MECTVIILPPDVRARLRDLGLTYEECIEVVEAMIAGANGCTDNDPPSAKGWESWRFGVRRWREIKRPHGWEKDETENLSTIVHPSAAFRIAVANTDEGTGLKGGRPKTKTAKGDGSRRAVACNLQPPLPLPEFQAEFDRQLKAAAAAHARIWYLCVYNDGDVVRAELSMPSRIEDGHFVGWKERVILIDEGGLTAQISPTFDEDFGPDIDVPVRRKG